MIVTIQDFGCVTSISFRVGVIVAASQGMSNSVVGCSETVTVPAPRQFSETHTGPGAASICQVRELFPVPDALSRVLVPGSASGSVTEAVVEDICVAGAVEAAALELADVLETALEPDAVQAVTDTANPTTTRNRVPGRWRRDRSMVKINLS